MRSRTLAIVAPLICAAALWAPSASAAPVLSFVGGGSFTIGETVSVDVVVSGLGGEIVAAYDLDVSYNAAAMSFFDVFFDIQLGDPLSLEVLEAEDGSNAGLVDFAAVSLLSDSELDTIQGDTVRLATLQFTALADGDTSSMAFVNFGDFNDVKGRNNRVIIPGTQVPEPASHGLVVLALAAAVYGSLRRRRPRALPAQQP